MVQLPGLCQREAFKFSCSGTLLGLYILEGSLRLAYIHIYYIVFIHIYIPYPRVTRGLGLWLLKYILS